MARTIGAKDITPAIRVAVVIYLTTLSKVGRLRYGTIARATRIFGLSRAAVEKIWGLRDDAPALVQPRRQYPPKKTRFSPEEVGQRVAAVPLSQRQTLRALEAASGITRSTLQRHLKTKTLRRFISRVKPQLTDSHKLQRLTRALAHVQSPIGAISYRFDAMYDVVHIDEKWVNMYKASSRYYLAADEALPYRSCPNKRYIGKVMFLAAVARPRYNFSKRTHFNGKIGIWPIVEYSTAKRTSKNRVVGTPTKNINMSRSVYVRVLKEKVFSAIREKWPGRKTAKILVQQDNAGPHVEEDHGEVSAFGQEGGWKIKMSCQPPRSPDCNILDLEIFNTIQSIQYRQPTNQIDGLIAAVESAFNSVKYQTIDKCFLTLQKVLECIISNEGGNDFKLPRVRKPVGMSDVFPTSLSTTASTVENGYKALTAQILNQYTRF